MRYGLCGKADIYDIAEKAGFDYVELPVNWVAGLSDEDWQELLKTAHAHTIKCERMNLLYPKTMNLFSVGRQEETAYLERAFSRARALGATIAVYGSGKSRMIPSGMDYKSAMLVLVEHARLASDIALKYGVSIVLEPLNRAETNSLHSVAEGGMFAVVVDRPNFALLADMFHMCKEDENWNDLDDAGSLIRHTHIAVRDGRKYPLSDADPDTIAFLDHLKRIGYDDTLSIEGKSEDIKEDAPVALAVLRRLHG